jgi:hypothetical protein
LLRITPARRVDTATRRKAANRRRINLDLPRTSGDSNACFEALATTACAARGGDISASLPETGTHASLTPDFEITNPKGGNATVQPTAIAGVASGLDGRAISGTVTGAGGVAGYFQISSPVKAAGSAIYAVSTAGTKARHPDNYGSAGFFEITSIENRSPALLAQTGSAFTAALEGISNGDGNGVFGILNGAGGIAVHGGDFSSCCGTGVFGNSEHGFAGQFSGGSDGAGACTYAGGGCRLELLERSEFEGALYSGRSRRRSRPAQCDAGFLLRDETQQSADPLSRTDGAGFQSRLRSRRQRDNDRQRQ